jgi:hypothetical protein
MTPQQRETPAGDGSRTHAMTAAEPSAEALARALGTKRNGRDRQTRDRFNDLVLGELRREHPELFDEVRR